jgi:hypothetical protein
MIRMDDRDLRRAMNHLAKAFKADKANKVIKRETSKRLRKALAPMVADRKARVLALPSRGGPRPGGSMRQAVARKTVGATRWTGKNTGVSIIQRARGMPRDFQYAGRMFNRAEGWHPQNLAGEVETQIMTPSRWFDDAAAADKPKVRQELMEALAFAADKMADDIRRVR